ncbi:MAG TPA: hypothetical protein VFS93_04260 [Terrimesophilobacter sp.]|nr:hypothetical protein [Terrimesophilobacter sp.]
MTLATNPCASGLDNPFTRIALIAFLAGVGGSLVIVVLSALTKDRVGVVLGVVALGAGIMLMLLGVVLGGAGYGWHCPDY